MDFSFDQFKQSIKKHPKLFYWARCWKYRNDEAFFENVIADKTYLPLESFGEQHPDQLLYHIYWHDPTCGFCSSWRDVLSLIYFADRTCLTPVVEFARDTLYAEAPGFLDTDNPFEYFFEPVSGVPAREIQQSRQVVSAELAHRNFLYSIDQRYQLNGEQIQALGEMQQKYLRLTPGARDYIYGDLIERCKSQTVLGVHVRGTDIKDGCNTHPVAVTTQEYLSRAMDLFHEGKMDAVFLATDESQTIAAFREAFGDKLLFYDDTLRSSTGKALHYQEKSAREHHHYLLGLEVMRDTYTLAHCSGLICGFSAVGQCAQIVKASHGEQFSPLAIIDKGVNHNFKFADHLIQKRMNDSK